MHIYTHAKRDVIAEKLIQNCLVISQNHQVKNATKAQTTKEMQTSLCISFSSCRVGENKKKKVFRLEVQFTVPNMNTGVLMHIMPGRGTL